MESRLATSTARLAADVGRWQKAEGKNKRDVTMIHLKPEVFGDAQHPTCNLKGAQTNWFLEYMVDVCLPAHAAKFGEEGATFLQAGRNLMKMLTLIRKHPVTFPLEDVQAFHLAAKGYLEVLERIGMHFRPKDHALQHQSDRILRQGAPALYSNWLDESINRLLRDVSGGAHAAVFYSRVLKEFQKAYNSAPNAKRRRLR